MIKNALNNFSEKISPKNYNGNRGYLIKDVDSSLIRKFILNFEANSYSKQLMNPAPLDTYIKKREGKELKNWDIFIPSPSKGNRRTIKTNNLLINTIRRRLRNNYSQEFKLTENNKVASSTVAQVGLSQSKIDELIDIADPKDKKNPKIFNCYGRKPLIILHFIDLFDFIRLFNSLSDSL